MALHSSPTTVTSPQSSQNSMWQKFKDQIPAVIITVLVVLGAAFWIHKKTTAETAVQQAATDALREQYAAELKASSEETRRQIDAVNSDSAVSSLQRRGFIVVSVAPDNKKNIFQKSFQKKIFIKFKFSKNRWGAKFSALHNFSQKKKKFPY